MLGGEVTAPDSYTYLWIGPEGKSRYHKAAEWMLGDVELYPLSPETSAPRFSPGAMVPLLAVYTSRYADHRDRLPLRQDEFVQEMLRRAEYIVCAIDSRQHKWVRRDTSRP